ncbi:hypothetical protein TELCIR_02943 [Teladorsagia circumcincta]|uniref:PiggyBac transposable element-derived protein domain-containing protein n=1 Tax=Teladorsagia circumcincta TaxID=45464 RepID=A0A2G9UZT8_TELCI|nr:hypothetical protein TELCIR_02943 [Teladorsagia circumcincta]
MDLVVAETNDYERKKMTKRSRKWTATTVDGSKQFIGTCLYMGIVRLPKNETIGPQNRSLGTLYGVKLFVLCSGNGYTHELKVYAGKDVTRVTEVAESVVMELMEGYLDRGRDLCTDNW